MGILKMSSCAETIGGKFREEIERLSAEDERELGGR